MYVRTNVCMSVCLFLGRNKRARWGRAEEEEWSEPGTVRFDPSVCMCLRDLLFEVVQLHGEGVLVHGGGERAAAPASASAAVSVPVSFAV